MSRKPDIFRYGRRFSEGKSAEERGSLLSRFLGIW